MREHIRRISRLALILLANATLLVALLVIIEGLSSYAFFLRDLVPRLRESNLSHTQYDSEIGWVGLPNVVIEDMYGPGAHLQTNAKGFRNAEDFPAKRDSDTRRIVCSGDSVTFGERVGNDQTFCHLLAELDPKLETINMGQVGYGVDQAYLWYKRDADDLDVDVHILAFITHDFMRMQYDKFMGIPRPVVVLEDGRPVVTNVPISQSTYAMPTWLAETLNSADDLRTMKLATKVRKKLNLAPRKVPGAWDARGAEEVEAVVAGLFEDLRDYDSARSRTTVLVYFPSVEELQQPNAELAYWMSVVESNARRLDIPFINFVSLFSELPAADLTPLFVDGYHFSESGNALVARELLKHLRDDPRTAGRFAAPGQSSDGQPGRDPGVCTPETCDSLGHVCGTPRDGCGGTLSCGVCGDGETCSGGTCVSASPPPAPPPSGTPYGHVVPSDVGKTIGVGVVGPVPTIEYIGPNPITQNGTLLENRIINGELRIEADNVTVRNCIINNSGGFFAINVISGDNVLIENNKINKGIDGKQLRISSPCDSGPGTCGQGNASNTTVRRNEATGGIDFVWINETNGLLVEDNYVHSLHASGSGHHDGFQTGPDHISTDPKFTITIRGNYFHLNQQGPNGKPNAIIFIDNGNTLIFESNYIAERWGGLAPVRIWHDYPAPTFVRYNVYDNVFKNEFSTGATRFAIHYQDNLTAPLATYACNRYADGSFIEQEYVRSPDNQVVHVTTGCPSYR